MTERNFALNGLEGKLPIVFSKAGEVFANSRDVAAYFEKRHDNVLRDIENLMRDCRGLPGERLLKFEEMFSTVQMPKGATRQDRSYDMNREAFSALAMGFQGKKALAFKLRYIEAFNDMEAALKAGPDQLGGDIDRQDLRTMIALVAECRSVWGRPAARRMWGMLPLPQPLGVGAPRRGTDAPDPHAAAEVLDRVLSWTPPGGRPTREVLADALLGDALAQQDLRARGLIADPGGNLCLANDHPAIRQVFAGTRWHGGRWREALLAIPGARLGAGPFRFGGGWRCRAVLVPFEAFDRRVAS